MIQDKLYSKNVRSIHKYKIIHIRKSHPITCIEKLQKLI